MMPVPNAWDSPRSDASSSHQVTVKPMVILLDFDGTLVGDVEWLASEYTLFQNQTIVKPIKYQPAYVAQDLDNGLIRPYLREFLLMSKERYPQMEFFVYTASETEWAEFIIPRVEQRLGIKFHRPFFTRAHCVLRQGSYIKSLDTVRPIIYKRLAKAYHMKSVTDIQSLILIDNTPNVLTDSRVQVVCPTYDYQYPVDLTRQIPMTALESFIPWLRPVVAPTKRFKNMQQFWFYFHRFMAELYIKSYNANKQFLRDQYWKRVTQAFSETDLSKLDSYELKAYISSRS